MNKIFLSSKKHYCTIIASLTFIIAIYLALATYHINFWPTDSQNPYIPVARQLFNLPYISYMHDIPVGGMFKLTMYAKETLVIGISVFQRILDDYESLYPNVLLLIFATSISAVLLYNILKFYFGEHIGFMGYLLFSLCFWPYLYVLQGAHPPLALMNFLCAVLLLQKARNRIWFHLFSGIFLGLMLFSSPTSPLYLFYYLALFIYHEGKLPLHKETLKEFLLRGFFILLGTFSVFLLFTLPHPIVNFRQFLKFLRFSQAGNNFVIYQEYLSQYFPLPQSMRGEGWLWIVRYGFFIMPIMFTAYLLCILWVLKESIKRPRLLWIILASCSTPLAVEIVQVAQFGRNYFSWLVGIIFLICFTIYDLRNKREIWLAERKRVFLSFVIIFIASHVVFNAAVFLTDILPSRMATTHIYRWLLQHRTNNVFTYHDHPFDKNMVRFFNNPKYANKVYFLGIRSLANAKKGYILVPPITGKTIWCECRLQDFRGDPFLTELFESGEWNKYVVASFKTMASSRIWNQEEELCTYQDLTLGRITNRDRRKGFAWILDAKKLQQDWFSKKLR